MFLVRGPVLYNDTVAATAVRISRYMRGVSFGKEGKFQMHHRYWYASTVHNTGMLLQKSMYCQKTSSKEGRLLSCTVVQSVASSCEPNKILDTTTTGTKTAGRGGSPRVKRSRLGEFQASEIGKTSVPDTYNDWDKAGRKRWFTSRQAVMFGRIPSKRDRQTSVPDTYYDGDSFFAVGVRYDYTKTTDAREEREGREFVA